MKVIVRVYDGELTRSAKEEILEALEFENLLLTGELDMPADAEHDGYHELTFEEEVVDAEVDILEEEKG